MDLAHSRIRGQTLFREPFVEPGQRRRELRILIAQAMHEFDREGLGKGLRATPGENGRRRFRGAPASRQAGDPRGDPPHGERRDCDVI